MAVYTRRPAGYTINGVCIGTYGRKLLKELGCSLEEYIDRRQTSTITPNGTRAWNVELPAGVEVKEPPSRITASGRKKKYSATVKRRTYGARWWAGPTRCQAEWINEDTFSGLPTTFTKIYKDGELVAGSRLVS
jgi:hypothetical protein